MTLLIEIFKISMKTPGKLLNLVEVVLPRWLNFLGDFSSIISSVIRQNGESQDGCFKKTNCSQIFRKTNISYPLICTRTYIVLEEQDLQQLYYKYFQLMVLEKPCLLRCYYKYYHYRWRAVQTLFKFYSILSDNSSTFTLRSNMEGKVIFRSFCLFNNYRFS